MRLHIIDSEHLGRARVIGVAVLVAEDGSITLIDPGPAVVFDAVQRGLSKLGLNPARVTQVLATHIHLDHSGSAWCWAEAAGARVFAHRRGVMHLIDPETLVASATRIYEDEMERLWGAVRPIDARQVIALNDGDEVTCGNAKLQAVDTPGHAQHHLAYWAPEDKLLFAGDAAGVVIDHGPVIPPCPPPDINVEQWKASLARLRAFFPARTFVTHFGEVDNPAARFQELEERLERRALWIRDQLRNGIDRDRLVQRFKRLTTDELRAAGIDEGTLLAYEQADPPAMSVTGLVRYWRKFHPESLAGGTGPPASE
ncbi:MAG: MBL fold metallo-hydrolase [Verrucomicrobia bacterium]|nr:MBL fold metallo-hydrolase [Verrucomicrobiota bacterium]